VKQLSESLGLSERAVRKLRRQVALECLPPRLADAACQDQDEAPLSAFESAAALYRHSVRQGGRLDSGCHRYAHNAIDKTEHLIVIAYVTVSSDSCSYISVCCSLNKLLGAGLALQCVTDIAGDTSTGKTQLCMTAAVMTAKSGIGVLYIDTANGCSARRLQSIATERMDAATVRTYLSILFEI
jgi:Rad51